ncbi:hypothetical protein K438DRAFT_1782450 [Mycena galopus ATCC 62051]|nr:hypothetical protein K438DRAFT_1782450 [Mycena galopus ATCC 62051]
MSARLSPSGEAVPPAEPLPVLLASATSAPSGEPVPPAEPLPASLVPAISSLSGDPVPPAEPGDETQWGGIVQDDNRKELEGISPPGSRAVLPAMDDVEEPWGGISEPAPMISVFLAMDDVEEPWEGISEPAPMLSAPPKKSVPNFGSDDEGALPEKVCTASAREAKDKLKNKKCRTAALNADLAELNKEHIAKVAELVAKHKFKVPLVQQRLYGASNFKKQRKVSLFRAQEHYLAKVLNEGRGRKERYSLHQIKHRVRTWPEFKNMSADFKAKLFEDLEMHRERKAKGARSTSKAAAQDAGYTLKRISSEMEGLLDRCGMYSVAFFTKGHIHDMIDPAIIQTGGALNFFREAASMDPVDLHVRFEQWCCARDKGFTGLESAPTIRKDITKTLKNGLVLACKRTRCAMNYERYIRVVVLGYGVILIGWPKSVEFTSPTNISSIDDLRVLYEALKDGTCRWKVLTAKEKEKWRKEYEEKIASGEIVEQARKERGDKGEERGANSRTQGKCAAGEKSKSKSKTMVEDSDEEESYCDEESNRDEEESDRDEDKEKDEEEEPVTKKKARSSKSASKQKQKKKVESEKETKKRKRNSKDEEEEKDEGEDEEQQSKKARRSAGEIRKRPREDDDQGEEGDCRPKKTTKPTAPAKAKLSITAKPKASVIAKTSTFTKPKPSTSVATRPKPTPAYRNASGSKSSVNDQPNQEDGSEIQEALKRNRDAATEAAVAQDIARRKGAEANAAIETAGALAAVGEISGEAQVAAYKKATDLDTAAKAAAARAAILTAKAEKVAAETAHLRNSALPSASNLTSLKNIVKGKKGGPPGMRGNA